MFPMRRCDSELTFCPTISDRSLEVEPRRRL